MQCSGLLGHDEEFVGGAGDERVEERGTYGDEATLRVCRSKDDGATFWITLRFDKGRYGSTRDNDIGWAKARKGSRYCGLSEKAKELFPELVPFEGFFQELSDALNPKGLKLIE